jgi:hypothetical protein
MTNETKKFGMTKRARKAISSLLLAGGLFGGAAKAAIPAPSLSDRVTTVRAEIHKRVTEAQEAGGAEAVSKLPYAELEVASWSNWANWANWNNWNNWRNWSNWSNWRNWINY